MAEKPTTRTPPTLNLKFFIPIYEPEPSLLDLDFPTPFSEPPPTGYSIDSRSRTFRDKIGAPVFAEGAVHLIIGIPLLLTECGINSQNQVSLQRMQFNKDACSATGLSFALTGAAALITGGIFMVAPSVQKALERRGAHLSSSVGPNQLGFTFEMSLK